MFHGFDINEPDIDGRNAAGDFVEYNFPSQQYETIQPKEHNYIDYSCDKGNYYQFKFKNEVDLISSNIFQDCLKKSLAFKDAEIVALRKELLKYLGS